MEDLDPEIVRKCVTISIMPGARTSIASFLSYNEAKRTSKDPDSFGKGNMKGLLHRNPPITRLQEVLLFLLLLSVFPEMQLLRSLWGD